MSGGSWVQSPVWPSFLFNTNTKTSKVLCQVMNQGSSFDGVIHQFLTLISNPSNIFRHSLNDTTECIDSHLSSSLFNTSCQVFVL